MDATTALAEFAVATSVDDVPPDARAHARTAVRDYLGVALYGSAHEMGEIVGGYVDAAAPGDAATVLGRGRASVPGAALANGAFGHAVDYDDTFESIVLHPTSPVFPAALATADATDADDRAVLEGYLVGVEAAARVGHATYPSHYDHGWHSTGTAGSFGAAAAAASVLDLPVAETEHAFGVVASCASSLKRNFGSMTKPLHAGHAAEMGVRAALLAREGFTADPSVLDGELGYGAVMTPGGTFDPDDVREGPLDGWAISDVGFKPYPSGVITHAAMDALRRLAEREDLDPADLECLTVTLDAAADEMLIHEDPGDALQAKFSIEFCLAAVLRAGDPGVREFSDDFVRDPETRALLERVERDFEPDLFGEEFAGYGARVVVETADGRRLEAEERAAPGGPSNPVSEDRLRAKYDACARAVVSASEADRIAEAVASFGEGDDAPLRDALAAASDG